MVVLRVGAHHGGVLEQQRVEVTRGGADGVHEGGAQQRVQVWHVQARRDAAEELHRRLAHGGGGVQEEMEAVGRAVARREDGVHGDVAVH